MTQDEKPTSGPAFGTPAAYNRAKGIVPDGLAWSLGDDTVGIMTKDELSAARARIAARKVERARAES
jgi:hypothetical protein